MTPERWRVVTDLFHAALARTPLDRAAFLAEACRDDAALQGEVEVLLDAHETTGSFGSVVSTVGIPASLPPGTALGPYVIERIIGAGGMGEVYRATDTRLQRTVAIKILPTHRRSPEMQARFDREARAISHLAHPHICTLHDVGHQDDTDYLVMEYLEGETLEGRLQRGAIPVEESLRIATEVASALHHAHRQGVVHRDLKPANVMLTSGGAKLLDFGVARILASADVASDAGRDATTFLTASGIRPGTLQYMSPEQLENGTADPRSDIWALGCVLYEMFGGRKPFAGETRTAVVDAIAHARPAPLALGQRAGSAALEHVVMTCIAKSPDDRWQSAADVGRQLQWIARQEGNIVAPVPGATHPQAGSAARRYRVPLVLMSLLSTAIAVVVWRWSSTGPQPEQGSAVLRLAVTFTENDPFIEPGGLAISPDGMTIVFAGQASNGQRLYMRRLRETEVRRIPGTDGAMAPFFSPDGKWVGFVVAGRGILKAPIDGGPAHPVCQCGGAFHATWAADDRIILSSGIGKPGPGLWVVSANGGTPDPLLRPPGSVEAYLSPEVLPGNKIVLFTIREAGHTDIAALNLETRRIDTLIPGGSHARYLPTRHIVYLIAGTLVAEGFDIDRLVRRNDARTLVAGIGDDQPGNGPFALSDTGTLGYIPPGLVAKRLVWVDRSGKTTPLDLPARPYWDVGISRDGLQLAITVLQGPGRNIWWADSSGGPLTQLTFGNDDMYGVFSPDGKDVLYTHGVDGTYAVFSIPADGSGEPRPLTHSTHPQRVTEVSRDGRTALLNDMDPETSLDILKIDPRRPDAPTTVRRTARRELNAHLSPDERWITYQSDEDGELTIHVQPFPGPGSWQVSPGRGIWPFWHPNGRELLYQADDAIYAIPIRKGRAAGPAERLLAHTIASNLAGDWTLGPDGRILLIDRAATGSFQIPLLLNLLNALEDGSAAPQRKRE